MSAAGSSVRRGARGFVLIAVLIAACDNGEAKPATQLLVTVDSDLVVGSELSSVQVEVRTASGDREAQRHAFALTSSKPKGDEVRLPFSFGIAKVGGNDFQLRVKGLAGDKTVIDHRWNVSFEDEKTLGLSVFLGAICAGNLCTNGQTCYSRRKGEIPAGACADVPDASVTPVKPGEELRERVAGESGAQAVEAGSGGAGSGRAGSGGPGAGGAGASGAGASGAGAAAAGRGAAGSGGAGAAGAVSAGRGAAGSAGAAGAGCGACRPGEMCVAGACQCASSVADYYRDADGDGHGDPSMKQAACGAAPVGYVSAGDDCCDSDNRAYPGQKQGDVTPALCDTRGFDFDCDENGEIGWPYLFDGVCCTNSVQEGWKDLIPACGETGQFTECDPDSCQPQSSAAKQRCY